LFQRPKWPEGISGRVPAAYQATVMRMLEKRPDARFQTWDEVRTSIKTATRTAGGDPHIEKIVDKVLAEKDEAERQHLILEKWHHLRNGHRDLVISQLRTEIVVPLQDFASEINERSRTQLLSVWPAYAIDDFTCSVRREGNNILAVSLHVRFDNVGRALALEEGVRYIPEDDGFTQAGRTILAWGGVEDARATGFNLLLLGSESSAYGEFVKMVNRNEATMRTRREPEPFVLSLTELPQRFATLDVVGAIVSKFEPFNLNDIKDMISSCI
jgi:hypothetical protein